MVLINASLLVSGLLWCSICAAGPVNTQQHQAPLATQGVKDTLIAGNALSTPSPDPYGFRPLLADNAPALRNERSENSANTVHTLTYNAEAHSMVNSLEKEYLKSDKQMLTHMKSWGVPYFQRIDKIMSDHGLPKELKYLAVIESELKHSATSRVGAKGLWQFMPETARLYGLTVNKHTDQRTDLDKSTRAAARYLQDLYEELHDWLLVIAAYDGGTNRIHSAIRKAGSRNFWDLQYYLPAECRNHVKRFIATNFYMEDVPQQSFFLPADQSDLEVALSQEELANTSVKTISGHFTAYAIAKHLSMSLPEFIRLNPNFDGQVSSSTECYNLRLPKDKMDIFDADQASILNESVRGLLNDDEKEEK